MKRILNLKGMAACTILLSTVALLNGQTLNKYRSIPRVDVHAHLGNDIRDMDKVMEMKKQVKEQAGIDLTIWINLGLWPELTHGRPDILDPMQPDNIEEVLARYEGKILPCINDYIIQDGLSVPPDQLVRWQWRGVEGYKIWSGDSHSEYLPSVNKSSWWAVDNPANDPTFIKMEQIGMVIASIHISTPYLPEGAENWKYGNNAAEYWSAIHAFEEILEHHPRLIFVGAHMLFLCSSKEQLDYLDYLLDRFPNLYVDVTAALPFLSRVLDIDYMKKFFLKRSDKILFGTDIDIKRLSGSYWDKTVKDDNFMPTYGHFYKSYFDFFEEKLALPEDVMEKIYYRNAMKIYPHVKESLRKSGYSVE